MVPNIPYGINYLRPSRRLFNVLAVPDTILTRDQVRSRQNDETADTASTIEPLEIQVKQAKAVVFLS